MEVKLPRLGEGAEAGVVVSVLVKVGDTVAAGQTVIELENEKAVAPIPSPVAGTVSAIAVQTGDRISVGQVILSVAEAGVVTPTPAAATAPAGQTPPAGANQPDPIAEAPAQAKPAANAVEAGPKPPPPGFEPPAAPTIRRIARELGIDLSRIRGSENGGRIVMADLRAYIQRLEKQSSTAPASQPPTPTTVAPTAAVPRESVDFSQWGPVSKKPLSLLRKVISRRMTESWTTIPHVTQFNDADITAVLELRKKYAAAYETAGARLTLTSFVLRAVAETLKTHPLFNASLDEAGEQIVFKDYCHVGVAVDTDAGLMVPVIRDADKQSLLQLSKAVQELAEKARARKVALEDLKGGTFTISNQGGIGGAHFTPIVNKPEVAILGLGRGALKPVVKDEQVQLRTMLPLALSYDHRVIDGGAAARFVTDLAKAIEGFHEEDVKI